jgi:hypothetical protein
VSNLGVRNNNWLNIRYNPANDWVGQTGGDDNNYAKFDDPVSGLRAADIVLKNYGSKHGIDNLNDAIYRFAPPEDNNPTPAYAKFVADKMGINPDDKIDLADPDTREKMIAAMVQFETPDAASMYSPTLLTQARGGSASDGAKSFQKTNAKQDAVADFFAAPMPANAPQPRRPATPQPTSSDAVAGFVSDLGKGSALTLGMVTDNATYNQSVAPTGLVETFKRGMAAGAESMSADMSYMGAAFNALVGDDEGVATSIENARIAEEFAALPMQGLETFGEFLDEPTVGGALEQAASGTGQLMASVVSSITGAGVGSIAMLLGKEALRGAGRQAAKNIIKDSVEATARKEATPDQQDIAQAAFEAAKEAHIIARNGGVKKSLKQGALLGAGVSEYAPMTGSNVSEALESGLDIDRVQAIRAGFVALPQAAIGVFGEAGLVKLLSREASRKSAGPNSVMGRLADATGRNFAKGAALEGTAELAQEELAIRNRMSMDDTFTEADANLRRLNAFFVGSVGGGALAGSGAGAIQGARELAGIKSVDVAASVSEKAADMSDSIKEFMTRARAAQDIADVTPDQTAQESEADINAQILAMLNPSSSKEAVWISGTEPDPRYAKRTTPRKIDINGQTAYAAFVPGRGTIISTDIDVVNNVVKGGATDAVLSAALGYSATKTGAETAVFRVYDADGGIVSEEAVTVDPESVKAAQAAAEKIKPDGGRVEFMSTEDAMADRARRAGPDIRNMEDDYDDQSDDLETDQDTNEERFDGEFEPETRTYTFQQDEKTVDSYQAIEGDNNFEGVEEARTEYAAMTGEDIDFSTPFYKRMSGSMLRRAVALQKTLPDEVVNIAINTDGSYRIEIQTTEGTEKIRFRDGKGNDREVSKSEWISLELNKAKRSQQKFRTINITAPGSNKSQPANPVDLMNAGKRLVEAGTGTFSGQGPTQSARQGLLAMLGELQMQGYEVDVQGVPIAEILENIADPTKELDKKISRITVAFDGGGNAVSLGYLLKPYVPGPQTVTNLEEVTDELGNTTLVSDEDAREARQDEDPLEPFEMAANAARTTDGIPLTDMNIEDLRNVDSVQNRPAGSAPSTGPARTAKPAVSMASGVSFPFGQVNDLVSMLANRLSRVLKLKVPTAVISMKGVDQKLRETIAGYLNKKTTAQARIALRKLNGDKKTKPLDLGDLEAVAAFVRDLQKDGLFNPKMTQHIDSVSDQSRLAFTFLERAAFDSLGKLVPNRKAGEILASSLAGQLVSKTNKGRFLGFEGGNVILVGDLRNVNEAGLAMVVAHEFGHALFKEEIDGVIANKALYKRLIAAFNRDRKKARDEGNPVKQWEEVGFEEWYADQVAAWVKKDMQADKAGAKNAADSHFKSVVKRFKKLWQELSKKGGLLFRRMDKVKPSFAKYMDGVTEARQSNRETVAAPMYNERGEVFASSSALGAIRVDEPAPAPEAGAVPAPEAEADQGGAGNTPPPPPPPNEGMSEPNEPSWEQKAVVAAIKNEINIQTGAAARAASWKRYFNNLKSEFLAKNPNALKILGLIYGADSILRIAAGDEVADMFYVRSNSRSGLGFVQARGLARDKWRAELFKVLGTDWTTQEVQDALKEAQGSTPTAELQNRKAKQLREYLERFHREYIEPSNSDIGFRPDYFPVLLNLQEVMNDPEAFIQLILENDDQANEKSVRRTVRNLVKYQKIVESDKQQDTDEDAEQEELIFSPAEAVEAKIQLTANVSPSVLRDAMYIQEPEVALMSYLDNVTKRVEWNKATRNKDGKDMLAAALKDLPPQERERAEAVLNAYLGNVTHLSPFWRSVNSYVQAINLVTLLPFAAFASIPDFAGSIVQTKEFNGFTMFAKEVVSQYKDREAAKRFANDIGVVMPEAAANAWMSQADSDMLDPKVRMATDKFFSWTGLSYLTTLSREFASGMAKRFLIEHANNPTERSERYLQQLGVTYDQVRRWQDSGFSFEGEDGAAVKAALSRFVESSVLRPNAAERPVWASDPRFAVVWQLKSFIYAFNKVILEGVEREIGQRILNGNGITSSMAPLLLLTMAAFMPLAALGLELREYAKVGLSYAIPGIDGSLKYLRTDSMDYGTYFGEIFQRAGLDGPLALISMAQRSGDWGGSALASLAGPTAELLEKTVREGPFDAAYSRTNSPQEVAGTILGIGAIARTIL